MWGWCFKTYTSWTTQFMKISSITCPSLEKMGFILKWIFDFLPPFLFPYIIVPQFPMSVYYLLIRNQPRTLGRAQSWLKNGACDLGQSPVEHCLPLARAVSSGVDMWSIWHWWSIKTFVVTSGRDTCSCAELELRRYNIWSCCCHLAAIRTSHWEVKQPSGSGIEG